MSNTLPQKLLAVQNKIGAVSKSSSNPHFRSKFADLNEVLSVAKEALLSEGVFISQSPGANEYGKYLETSLIDADSGQQIQGRVFFSGAEDNMQKIGAAITYARRFGIVSLLALESADDDGEEAVGRGQGRQGGEPSRPVANQDSKPGGTREAIPPKAATPVQAAVPQGPSRKTINEKISLTSKVLIDSKKATQEEVGKMLAMYQVKTKEELNDDQARKLLTQLEEKLK